MSDENKLKYILKAIADDPSIPYQDKINSVIALGSATCAIIAVQPIPFADILILTPIQMAMVYYLNKIILDEEDSEVDAGKLLTTLGAVTGAGLAAQQAILGLYKIGLPGLAGFTTIPLVYGATSAIGYSAVKLLEVKAKNKDLDWENLTPQQKIELQRLTEQAKQDAKRNKPKLSELKSRFANATQNADEYYRYKDKISSLENDNQNLQNKIAKLQAEIKQKQQEHTLFIKGLEDEQLELMLQNENLDSENKALLEEYLTKQRQYQELERQLLQKVESKRAILQDRLKLYKNIVFEKNALDEFARFTKDSLVLEEKIGMLNYAPDKVSIRDKIENTDFFEIRFKDDGRIYGRRESDGKYHIYKIGNKATQPNDIKYLKSL